MFKRAPAVLITLSLGALTHTDAGTHICECTAALVEREEEEEQQAAAGRGEVLLPRGMLVSEVAAGAFSNSWLRMSHNISLIINSQMKSSSSQIPVCSTALSLQF